MRLPQTKLHILFAVIALGVFVANSRPAYADAYTFTVFNYPGSFLTGVLGINNNGDTFGYLGEPFETQFLYQNGIYSLFPGIVDVNNQGAVLFNSPSGPAILFDDVVTPVSAPGPVVAFNSNGSILVSGGFVKKGVFYPVNYPGSTSTTVTAINDLDEVVGTYSDSNGRHGFLYKHGVYTSFDFPAGWINVRVIAVNNNDEIVGNYQSFDPMAIIHGFTYENGNYQSFNAFNSAGPGDATIPTGINDFGEISGTTAPEVGAPRSFVATPVPEPGTLGLVGSGLMAIAGAVRRRMC
jgi:hypothetical protein